jgi:RimJ/RimL family protein N-acetyltransferase
MRDLFRGELVRLTAEDPESRAKIEVNWQRDSEYHRLMDADPARMFSEKQLKAWIEGQIEKGFTPRRHVFSVRTLDDDKLIGFFALWLDLVNNEAWVGIGIGERDFWGRGYGTDMMRLALQYAFTELNVHRVSLGLFEYNPRALRSYEKAGFRLEGRTRRDVLRGGERGDSLWMGILRDEWFAMQNGEKNEGYL